MGKIVKKIVLTGGPGSGKSTTLSKIVQEYSERGYKVVTVPEAASLLINNGIKCFGEKPHLSLHDFQDTILKMQLSHEKIYEEAAERISGEVPCLIIYDRAALDNKAYLEDEAFKEIVISQGHSEIELLNHYDLVIHLVTAADGHAESYTLENNKARSEDAQAARELDNETLKAWSGKDNIKIVPKTEKFEDKVRQVITHIDTALGYPTSMKYQVKYEIDLSNSDIAEIIKNSTETYMEQTYIDNPKDELERRLRMKVQNGEEGYYFTLQNKQGNGESILLKDRSISKKQYLEQLATPYKKYSLNKRRYTFMYNKQYFRLDIFEDVQNAILEVEPTIESQLIEIPVELKVIADVTNDKNYENFEIAKKLSEQTLKRKRCK